MYEKLNRTIVFVARLRLAIGTCDLVGTTDSLLVGIGELFGEVAHRSWELRYKLAEERGEDSLRGSTHVSYNERSPVSLAYLVCVAHHIFEQGVLRGNGNIVVLPLAVYTGGTDTTFVAGISIASIVAFASIIVAAVQGTRLNEGKRSQSSCCGGEEMHSVEELAKSSVALGVRM